MTDLFITFIIGLYLGNHVIYLGLIGTNMLVDFWTRGDFNYEDAAWKYQRLKYGWFLPEGEDNINDEGDGAAAWLVFDLVINAIVMLALCLIAKNGFAAEAIGLVTIVLALVAPRYIIDAVKAHTHDSKTIEELRQQVEQIKQQQEK